MPRAVLDANVFISAALRPEGPPGRLIELFLRTQAFALVLSPAIVDETLRALAYPKLKRLLPAGDEPLQWFEDIAVLADLVPGEIEITGVCADPDDDKYIAAAIEGRAAFVVTGDRKLLAVERHEGVLILPPRGFLELLKA